MNYNLTPDEITEVKQGLEAWIEILDRNKELAAERKAVLEKVAAVYECKAGKVSKLFKSLKQKMDDGESEIDDIVLMEETIKDGD